MELIMVLILLAVASVYGFFPAVLCVVALVAVAALLDN